MKAIREWIFPVGVIVAWMVTTAYTVSLVGRTGGSAVPAAISASLARPSV